MIGRTNAGMSGTKYSIKNWCATVGLTYNTLSEITEADMRTLMTKYASVAYFMEWYAADSTMITDFIANTKAMKWIGLRDYICDKLMAISDFKTKALASDNWEYILKDHVPIMTSASAPYGNVSAGNTTNDYYPYFAFNQNTSSGRGEWLGNADKTIGSTDYIQYQFTNPTCVRKMKILNTRANGTYVLRGWNDASNKVDLASGSYAKTEITVDVSNNNYYLYYGLFITATEANFIGLKALQFYGRSLNVSVPTMTSDTSPYGETKASSVYNSNRYAYLAFDGDSSTSWMNISGEENPYIQYKFSNKVCVKFVTFLATRSSEVTFPYKVLASNDGEHFDKELYNGTIYAYNGQTIIATLDNANSYLYYRIQIIGIPYGSADGGRGMNYRNIQFFGLDYSERSDRTYLYDHGVELIPMSMGVKGGGDGLGTVTENASSVTCACPDAVMQDQAPYSTDSTINMTQYNSAYATYDNGYCTSNLALVRLHISQARNIWSNVGGGYALKTIQNVPYGTLYLDASNINDAEYVVVGSAVGSDTGGACSVDFTEIWLE